ncbi:MAG: TatD family hydrolase [Rhizobiaceae bacterium]|nr:TatD family hydrolase [Rhizobiaceae bacterium]
MIDLHCHLDLYPDPAEMVRLVTERGIYVLSVTTTPRAFPVMKRMIKGSPRIRLGLGLHPELVAQRHSEVDFFPALLGETAYVGEVGIDGSPANRASVPLQERTFRRILKHCSDRGGRILSIHSRGAAGRVIDCLAETPGAGTPVLHWFSGSAKELERAVALGAWFSVGPAMTRSERGRFLVAGMPRDRVLTETDGPFARDGNTPFNPWDVTRAETALAELWGIAPDRVRHVLSANLRQLSETSDGALRKPA